MGMRKVLGLCRTILRNWSILILEDAGNLVNWAEEMEHRSMHPPWIAWQPMQGGPNLVQSSDGGVCDLLNPDGLDFVSFAPHVGEGAS
jgi:hypothetical protein